MSPSTVQEGDGVAAVDRALLIVDVIAQRGEPITLADLSRATGFYKSTLLRLIASLERASLVIRRSDGRYALGSYAHQLGRCYEAAYRLSEVVQPVLEELVDKGSESGSFHTYHDAKSRICLLRVDSHHSTLDRIRVGDLLPLDRGAAGKLITLYDKGVSTLSDNDLLAISMGERDPNCAAVASPVFGPDNEFCGAISLSGPKERFTPAAVKKMSRMVTQAAEKATITLGGRWPSRR
ncbi:IclR family transcriptional regulator [Pollutimonas harenae]|uniref:Helix-turn-helix domain-containing protein n=1 Tax=Pollutimonas harenae TaxID=657015 RepID=A0A853GQS3_9BURK|nr:helix-turn-helix domain-containing protein [Pollutimonas harenae]NYT84501.1 helix-turn-helix domain-containing protein [Pollutimonas harenae]TEA73105.1 IclR family transcriptional regulator [Pollutimonas harenae]